MEDFNFGVLDLIGGRLEKHKDKLGPFYRPLNILFGSAIFVALLAMLIGLPMLLLEDFNYISLGQFFLLAVYFMLLLTIKQNVFDRFVFCLALFIIIAAGPVLISTESFLNILRSDNEDLVALIGAPNDLEVFLYSFLRGMGNVLWAMPMLFMFWTFYPRYKSAGKARVNAYAKKTIWFALIFQLIATILVPWLAGGGKAFASVPENMGSLGDEIHKYQIAYLVFLSAYLLTGFISVLAAGVFFKGNDKRWLGIVISGLVIGQFLYVISSYNGRQITVRYPGSRTTADSVELYQSQDGTVVFTDSRLHKISRTRYSDFVTYAICEGNSGEFTFKVETKAKFDGKFPKKQNSTALHDKKPLKFFCPIDIQ